MYRKSYTQGDRGGVKGQDLDFFGLDLDRSKCYILLCAFDRISKFGPVDPQFVDLWGWVGPWRGVFLATWRSSMTKESKKVLGNVL